MDWFIIFISLFFGFGTIYCFIMNMITNESQNYIHLEFKTNNEDSESDDGSIDDID